MSLRRCFLVAVAFAVVSPPAAASEQHLRTFDLDVSAMNARRPAVGTVIGADNVARFTAILDENLVALIRQGMLSITVGETYSIKPHTAYLDATREFGGRAELGAQPGVLHGYIAGRPFPADPDASEPRAGDRIAWNIRYAYSGDSGEITRFYWQYRNVRKIRIERELSFYASQIRFMHRHVEDPVPRFATNPGGIYSALYLRVLAPPDLRNSQLLIHRLEDDTKQEQAWLYMGTQRRVRRLASGQTTDAFFGSDIMIEDFLGYNGRIMDMKWRYRGTRDVLLPFYRHDELPSNNQVRRHGGFRFVDFGGKGDCFPDVSWQVRRAHIITAEPYWKQHPLSMRRYYVDAQTYMIAYANLYDRSGKLWKIGYAAFSHPDHHDPHNRGSGVPVIGAATQFDLQAMHCTTLQFLTVINSRKVKTSDFGIQALRVKGR